MKHLFLITLLAFIIAAIFYIFPEIDIYISSFFFTNDGLSGGFMASKEDPMMYILYNVPIIVLLIFSIVIIRRCIIIMKESESFQLSSYKVPIYLLLVCIFGLGFIVETAIKSTFNRPRPLTVQEFGGSKIFAPNFVISDQCNRNCSFVSGHASAGFLLFALAFIMKNKNNRIIINLLAVFIGLLAGFGRIMLGKHFLSDIIFAGIVIYLVSYIFAILFKLDSVTGNYDRREQKK